MSHEIVLYSVDFARPARCRWTLLELGLAFDEVNDGSLIGSDALRKLHPQGKMPAITVDGEPLFESLAICNYLCDLVPDNHLLAPAGTRERALHDQWTSFTQSEMEGYLWSNAKHTAFYPEEKRVPAILAPNNEEFRAGAAVLDELFASHDYLVADRFSLTDIYAGWTVNWGRRMQQLDGFTNLQRYNKRLLALPNCPFNPD